MLHITAPRPAYSLLAEKSTINLETTLSATTPEASHFSINKPFSISSLPRELRQQIYTSYFQSQPPVAINNANATLPLHNQSSLAASSPFFPYDTPSSFYYQNTIFSFSCGEDMKKFSESYERKRNVRRIRIEEGREGRGRDWVFLMMDCFEDLEDVEFVLDGAGKLKDVCASCGKRLFEAWWEGVKDAAREGRCGKKGVLMLKVRERGGCERVTRV